KTAASKTANVGSIPTAPAKLVVVMIVRRLSLPSRVGCRTISEGMRFESSALQAYFKLKVIIMKCLLYIATIMLIGCGTDAIVISIDGTTELAYCGGQFNVPACVSD